MYLPSATVDSDIVLRAAVHDHPLIDLREGWTFTGLRLEPDRTVATVIDRQGVAVRAGTHCAMPLLERFGATSTCRASFGLYNTMAEVDKLAEALRRVPEAYYENAAAADWLMNLYIADKGRIAFLRESQLWLLAAEGGEPEQLTDLPLGAGAPMWSPDGTKLAFGAPVDLHAEPGEDDTARLRRVSAPIVVDRLDHHADGAGEFRTIRQHLHVLEAGTRRVRQVTDGDWHAGPPGWSPDGT